MHRKHDGLMNLSNGQILVHEDWEMFRDCFPDIGCIKLFKGARKAYMDSNAVKLLNFPASFDNSLSVSEFEELMRKFTPTSENDSPVFEYNGRELEAKIKSSETTVLIFLRAMSDNHTPNVGWDEKTLLNNILARNLLSYHLQPIVNARNGNIIAYEALMRIEGDTHISPNKFLEMAKRHGKLYDIEKATFTNVLSLISEHEGMFDDKKIFINSIPGAILTSEDVNELIERFGDLFSKVVIEITEQTELTDEILGTIRTRYERLGSEIAIDDFGSGYANSSSLLRALPDYVKLDQQLISDIDHDYNKQQLVSGYIAFCKTNGILVLAEGVENLPEMKWVIRAGVDLIQGFFTSRPQSVVVCSIPHEVQSAIVKTNLEKPDNEFSKAYMSKMESDINLLKLAEKKYTDIVIDTESAVIRGVTSSAVNINVRTENNLTTKLTLSNVNIRGVLRPTIIIGEQSSVEIVLEGKNIISYEGIYVPESSSLRITGDGTLFINADHNNGTGIGGNFESKYGNIEIDIDGRLEVNANGDRSVCIGGGENPTGSEVNLKKGTISLLASGVKSLAAGNYEGNARVSVGENCMLKICNTGENTVGIGTFDGACDIRLCGNIELSTSGKEAMGVGAMNDGTGIISAENADIKLGIKTRRGAALGSVEGDVLIKLKHSTLFCKAEGDCIASIGDTDGSGSIFIDSCRIDVEQASGERSIEVGTKYGDTKIVGTSEINAEVNV